MTDEVFPRVPLRQWVISFPFPLRYLFAAHPCAMGKVLRIVYRAISTHLLHKAGLKLNDGATGAVTLIQRFGWHGIPAALNLNIRFHILFLDGVYVYRDNRPPRFQRVKAPLKDELKDLVQLISQRVGRCLERQGLLEQDSESAWLELDRCRARPRRRDGCHAPYPGQFCVLPYRHRPATGSQDFHDSLHPPAGSV